MKNSEKKENREISTNNHGIVLNGHITIRDNFLTAKTGEGKIKNGKRNIF